VELEVTDVLPFGAEAAAPAFFEHYFGELGTFAYRAFAWANKTLFEGALPTPAIVWTLTPHGKCLGFTRAGDRPPVVTLHPSILGGTELAEPWGISPDLLGHAYALDVLVHELMHVSVHYRLLYTP